MPDERSRAHHSALVQEVAMPRHAVPPASVSRPPPPLERLHPLAPGGGSGGVFDLTTRRPDDNLRDLHDCLRAAKAKAVKP